MMKDAQSNDMVTGGKLVDSVVASTGLSAETVQGLMMADDDLDALCDAVLAQFAQPPKASGSRK